MGYTRCFTRNSSKTQILLKSCWLSKIKLVLYSLWIFQQTASQMLLFCYYNTQTHIQFIYMPTSSISYLFGEIINNMSIHSHTYFTPHLLYLCYQSKQNFHPSVNLLNKFIIAFRMYFFDRLNSKFGLDNDSWQYTHPRRYVRIYCTCETFWGE